MLALMLNIIPFFSTCFLYEGGIAVLLMLPALQFLLNILNYKWTKRILSFVILNSAMLISNVASIEIITKLYYNNISSDTETLAVGNFAMVIGIVFIVVMTLISIVCRIVSKKKNQSKMHLSILE